MEAFILSTIAFYFCSSLGNEVTIYYSDNTDHEIERSFVSLQPQGRQPTMVVPFEPLSIGERDEIGRPVVTISGPASLEAKKFCEAGNFACSRHLPGFSAEIANALAEFFHREPWVTRNTDSDQVINCFNQKYRNSRNFLDAQRVQILKIRRRYSNYLSKTPLLCA